MAHKNREKRAERKAREAERYQDFYEEEYDEDDDEYDEPRRRRGPHPGIVALIVIVLIAAGGYFGYGYLYKDSLSPVDPNSNAEVVVIVQQGDSTSAIAKALMDRGLLKGGTIRGYLTDYFFKNYCQKNGYNIDADKQFKYGEYTFTKNMTIDEIAAKLIEGVALAQTKHFTIPEGLTIREVGSTLAADGIVTESAFDDEVRNGVFDYPFLTDCPPGAERLEGFLYPETYEVYDDATAHDVVEKMLSQFNSLFTTQDYARAKDMGMSVRDIVTMASIIEREAVVPEERPIMAGVFYNRLAKGMRLESCATIQYNFIINGEQPKEFLSIADTQIPSEYNTYLIDGLPPGPICNPRYASIQAALYPDENDYIYFVLSDSLDGSHKFSADYSEFEKNKAAYYAAVDAR